MGKLGDSLDFSWPRKLLSLLLLQMSIWGSDAFVVIGPAEPIIATLGADTVLPCRVSPVMSVETMELRWSRSQFSEAVYVYRDGKEQVGEQLVDFKGRTELVKDYITEGRAAVKIYSLQVSDNGIYKCFFKKGNDFEEAILELKVIGLGSGPHIRMVGPEEDGIKVTCTGKGWFPQPEVHWKDEIGRRIPSLSEDETPDDDGLFHMEASLIVRDSSRRTVSCSMKNPVFGEERVETISIPEPFFPRTSPWKTPFIVTLLMLGVFMGAVGVLIRKHQEKKRRLYEAQKEKAEECQTIARRKELYSHDWEKAYLYGDWRKEYFKAVAVSLDPDSAHPNLKISENRRHVSWTENIPQDCDPQAYQRQGEYETIHSVLGQDRFAIGRHFWEVEVNMERGSISEFRWSLGVCSETVNRKGWFVEEPEKNFWVVACVEGEIKALTCPPVSLSLRKHPRRIGLFLDLDAGDVSFYNMNDGSHIYSFTGITFCGAICPYFSLQGPDTSATICLASDPTKECPDSPPKTSLPHVTNCDPSLSQEANSLLPQ
ncbi:butyrophilin subfamily 1 member A1-like [Echinops telfairi]|uniref:Butyrophilin subfamily 1 member A1-like n=1 Tax=Echinops telfairi TaxID=9371 RepID=A0AC55D8Y5_ECHTE|nr:butyrophilin subfamily 1 member A1-like [Echinops telfairi]